MTQKKKPHLSTLPEKTGSKKRKKKLPTQQTDMEPVMIMGPTGKLRMSWQPWAPRPKD